MRYVKFIKALVVDKVPCENRDSIRYSVMQDIIPIVSDRNEVLLTNEVVQDMVVPVHHLCRNHKDYKTGEIRRTNTFIAYSKEVQELLEMPFDVIKSELESCRALCTMYQGRLSDVKHANLWTRIKYLFKQEEFK